MFDYLVPNLTFLTSMFFELIVSHHGRILGIKSIKTHKFQGSILHLPLISIERPSTLLTSSANLWKNRPLVYSEGLIIKSIPPLLHRIITQIQTTKWPAHSEIERPKSVPKKPCLAVVKPNLHVVEVKVELLYPKMTKMAPLPGSKL